MTSSKHEPQTKERPSPFRDDLERNPLIGGSKGAFATGEDPLEMEGDSTVEGDVENDSGPGDGAIARRRPRSEP